MLFLRLAELLDEPGYVAAAELRARRLAGVPHQVPDLLFGAAGSLLFLTWLAQVTGEPAHLRQTRVAGDLFVARALPAPTGAVGCYRQVGVPTPGVPVTPFLGLSHGAAGMGLALAELAQATGVEKYLEIAKAAAQLLLSQAVAGTEGGWRWARDLNQPMLATQQWCHGVLGIGRFFLRLARQGPDPRYLEAARRAAQTVIGEIDEVEYSGLCHGVAGSGSFLLDCYQYFAEPRYLKEAQRCGERLQRFRVPDSTGVYAMTANGSISPHLFRGYAGVGMFALRLAHPETLADPILG